MLHISRYVFKESTSTIFLMVTVSVLHSGHTQNWHAKFPNVTAECVADNDFTKMCLNTGCPLILDFLVPIVCSVGAGGGCTYSSYFSLRPKTISMLMRDDCKGKLTN